MSDPNQYFNVTSFACTDSTHWGYVNS